MKAAVVIASFLLLSGGLVVGVASGDEPAVLQGVALTTDRTVDSTSHQAIAKGVWREGMNEQQKAYAMWRYFVLRNMHKEAAGQDDSGNAAELMTKTGYALCGTWADLWGNCMADNGMTATRVGLNGHWIGAVQYWGDWHAYDTDMAALYVKADGVVANPNETRNLKGPDGKYVLREGAPVKSFPWYVGPDSVKGSATLYARTEINKPYEPKPQRKWVYDLRLRPGQEMTWSWYGDPEVGFVAITHVPKEMSRKPVETLREYLAGSFDYYRQQDGKPAWHWGDRRGGLRPNPLGEWNGVCGNGRLTMDLAQGGFKHALAMAQASDNLEVKDGKLTLKDSAKPGTLTLDFKIPYAYGDAWLAKPLPEKGLKVELSLDGKSWRAVYPAPPPPASMGAKGPAVAIDDGQRLRLFDFVRGKSSFALRLTLEKDAPPLAAFKAVGAFQLAHTTLPALLKGKNQVAVRLANPAALAAAPLHVTYVYDQVGEDRRVMRQEKVLSFRPDALAAGVDTGEKHWPLMREIRLRCGGEAPQPAAPAEEKGELDWGAAPWEWVYSGVNFWNDFERGDRQGWAGALTTKNTFGGSDFALDNSLLQADGGKQLKLIRSGAFLNRDTTFRCQFWTKNVGSIRIYTRWQDEPDKTKALYEKRIRGLKEGEWQTLQFTMNELALPNEPEKTLKNNQFLANIYIEAYLAEGKERKDAEFMIDNPVCWDGQLACDPTADPEAPAKALANDPIWNAKPAK